MPSFGQTSSHDAAWKENTGRNNESVQFYSCYKSIISFAENSCKAESVLIKSSICIWRHKKSNTVNWTW